MKEYNFKSGETNGHSYRLMRRSPDSVIAGATPYVLYVDGDFYCTCDSLCKADEEIESIE